MPQGSVLEPSLFLLYINGLDSNTVTQVLIFDTMLYSKVDKSNNNNYKCLHLGHGSSNLTNKMIG